jgi:hypothetical protein
MGRCICSSLWPLKKINFGEYIVKNPKQWQSQKERQAVKKLLSVREEEELLRRIATRATVKRETTEAKEDNTFLFTVISF